VTRRDRARLREPVETVQLGDLDRYDLELDALDWEPAYPWDRRERTRAAPLRVPLRTAARLSPA
jgi:hypothetical protein